MTPAQFLARAKKKDIPPVILFLGQEGYNRRRCRDAVVAALGIEPEQIDMAESSLAAVVDDARAMSLFASERLIFARAAETAMPRTSRAASASSEEDEEGDDEPSAPSGRAAAAGEEALLAAYAKDPTPGVTLIFEAVRWDFDGDDKTKTERVRKFYGAIPEVVEFRRFTPEDARAELDRLAREMKITLEPAAAEALVEALAADMGRIAVELEKLGLYGKPVTAEALPLLVPDARQSTIFALVNALGRRDRARSLDALDALV
ncbi:MAG TPA: hypothetical protein VHC72_16470, partial [Bryobacteraceae bacterium]|nr:hypothetical protein [Bryobacteraceae bacterium]